MDEAGQRRVAIYHLERAQASAAWRLVVDSAFFFLGVVLVAVGLRIMEDAVGLGLLVLASGVVAGGAFGADASQQWTNRVEAGAKLAELDAPPRARPWLPVIVAALISTAGTIAAALITLAK